MAIMKTFMQLVAKAGNEKISDESAMIFVRLLADALATEQPGAADRMRSVVIDLGQSYIDGAPDEGLITEQQLVTGIFLTALYMVPDKTADTEIADAVSITYTTPDGKLRCIRTTN